MGASKEQYMEMMTIEMQREQFEFFCNLNGLKNETDYRVKSVEVPDFPYSDYEEWNKQKKISVKAYKKLKEIEFNIRNK